jgi:4,5:9,10-diseco-3-hydroxy-5,9,17-trioxoandrosta-1(10),2-diene-4-oate hydrolase
VAKGAIAGMVRMFRAGEEGAAWFDAAFDAYYRAVLPSGPSRAQRARILAAGRESAGLLARAWESFAEPAQDLRSLGATISRPVLFTWATRDRFVQLWRSRPAILEYANARIEEFAAGHSPHLEMPDEFLKSFERFMGEVGTQESWQEKM